MADESDKIDGQNANFGLKLFWKLLIDQLNLILLFEDKVKTEEFSQHQIASRKKFRNIAMVQNIVPVLLLRTS